MSTSSHPRGEAIALSFQNAHNAKSCKNDKTAVSISSERLNERSTSTVDTLSSHEIILFSTTPTAGSSTPRHTFEHESTVDGAISFLFDFQQENGLLLEQEEDIADAGLDASSRSHSCVHVREVLSSYDTRPLRPVVARNRTPALGALGNLEEDDADDLTALEPVHPSSSSANRSGTSN
ncbi:hypothetical protein DL93DRAFT_2101826 [Clavulina sp. PMI_390]|nr:hypothetical protein DL93DRAFT_2101826 [Clavulina sp. PMI_390]